jgi:GMP synthase-like glutamine amidotransferase
VTALVIGNRDDGDPGLLGAALADRGMRLVPLAREQPGDWPGLDGVELLVVLGSAWSVYWDSVRDIVDAESAYVAAAHRIGVPTLAVCYGAQLAAHALGGSVHRAAAPELGWYDIESAGPHVGTGPWFQWHSDTFVPPPGAEVLAPAQMFVTGSLVAVQFHPEVDAAIVARWCDQSPDDLVAAGVSRDEIVERSRDEAGAAPGRAARLVDWFLSS